MTDEFIRYVPQDFGIVTSGHQGAAANDAVPVWVQGANQMLWHGGARELLTFTRLFDESHCLLFTYPAWGGFCYGSSCVCNHIIICKQHKSIHSGHDQFMLDSSQWLAEVTPYVPRYSILAVLRIRPSRLSAFTELPPGPAPLGLNLHYPKEISFLRVPGDWQDWESRRCSYLYVAESTLRVFDRCTGLELSPHERQGS